MSYSLLDVHVSDTGLSLKDDSRLNRIEHPAVGVYNVYCDTDEDQSKIHCDVQPALPLGSTKVVGVAVPVILFDGVYTGARIQFFEDFDKTKPIDVAFRLNINSSRT